MTQVCIRCRSRGRKNCCIWAVEQRRKRPRPPQSPSRHTHIQEVGKRPSRHRKRGRGQHKEQSASSATIVLQPRRPLRVIRCSKVERAQHSCPRINRTLANAGSCSLCTAGYYGKGYFYKNNYIVADTASLNISQVCVCVLVSLPVLFLDSLISMIPKSQTLNSGRMAQQSSNK